MIKPPCLKCEDRYPACHDYCKAFIDWKFERELAKAEARLTENPDITAYNIDHFAKLKKKRK